MSARALPAEETPGHGFEGRVLGGFRMVREIACGGMATVYLAHKSGPAGFGQPAAVKVIHPHLARDRDFVEMFLDEARIVSCINHPNVCRVLDFGKAEGTYYLAMEYVMGETWGDVLTTMKARPEAQSMIPALLAQVMAQACEGLHAAHEARDPEGKPLSIVHRDISPQNIIVGYDGSVRVLDFGIASAAERLHTTRNGTIKGRFAYMAPEQMRGIAVDRRADIWSLGVVLWEGLGQRRLFKRDTEAETVLAVTQDPLPSLGEGGHAVPSALARISTQALTRDREGRYATAREMGLALSRFAGSSLVPVGMAEVSLWMQRLFADHIEQKRQVMREAARAADAGARSSIPPPPPDADDEQLIDTIIENARPSLRAASSTLPSVSTVREVPRETIVERPQRRLLLGPIVAVGLFLIVVLVAGRLAPTAEAPSPTRTTAATSAATSTARAIPAAAEAQPAPKALATAEPTSVSNAEPEPEPKPKPEPKPVVPKAAAVKPAAPSETKRSSTRAPVTERAAPVKRRTVVVEPALPGSINIATPGFWADVYLAGKRLGTTPGRFELPAGPHVLRLRPFGKQPELTRKIEVVPGEVQKLKVSLD